MVGAVGLWMYIDGLATRVLRTLFLFFVGSEGGSFECGEGGW